MYKLFLRHLPTGKVKEIEFNNKEEMDLYKKYHITFHGWDKAQKWVHERFIKEEERKYIVSEQEKSGPNKSAQKWFLVRPEWNFVDIEIDPEKAIVVDWDTLRAKRDWMLKETDHSQLAYATFDSATKGKYREYRTYLRNLPLNFNEESIGSAIVMTFDEWREFFRK
jgi:hypothetical protein